MTSIFCVFIQNAGVHVYVYIFKIRIEALYVRSKRMKLKSNIVYHLNKKSVLKTKKARCRISTPHPNNNL